jgi:hypothetical protein
MRCPHCQHENHEGARFCAACGSAFASPCPACGSQPPPGAAFCDHGGIPLTGTTTAATSPSLRAQTRLRQAHTPPHRAEEVLQSRTVFEGERKQITVLCADLKGLLEWLSDRDPEEARQLLDPVLGRRMAAVQRYEGTVNQVMVTASWPSSARRSRMKIMPCGPAMRPSPCRRRSNSMPPRSSAPKACPSRCGSG